MTSGRPEPTPRPAPDAGAPQPPALGVLAVIRFLSELALLTALAYLGSRIGGPSPLAFLMGLALPAAAAVIWGLWVAPRASRRLRDPGRLVVELVLFVGTAAALFLTRHWVAALALLGVYAAGARHRRSGG